MNPITRTKKTSSQASKRVSRSILGTTAEVNLVTPVGGFNTQEDANIHFNERITAIETEINAGTY